MNKKEKIQVEINSKGITLVSLVVTIIILIILATASISLTLGDNGIITIAKRARENIELAKVEEETRLNELYMQMEQEETTVGNSYDAIEKLLEFKKAIAEAITNKGIKTNETDSKETIVENIGKIKTVVEDQTVIGPVTGGSYDNPYIPSGFRHFRGNGTWNDGYVIEDEEGNQFVWVPCVTDQSKVKNGDTVVTFGKVTTGVYNSTNSTTTEEGTTASEIETSVEDYGGFYIARYEAGIEGKIENYSLDIKTVTNGDVKPLSKAGFGVWNSISRADAMTVANSMIDETTGAKSALISGACWDTTLQWIVNASDNKNREPNLGYDTNSVGKGWYSDISNNVVHTTGYYAVNNIYDMGGNVSEYTTENKPSEDTDYKVYRGGKYDNTGSALPAAVRNSASVGGKTAYIGFRVVLYK